MFEILRQGHRVEGAAGRWRSGEAQEVENYVRSAKSGQVAKYFGVIMTRPTLAVTFFLLSLSLLSLFVCQAKGVAEVDPSARGGAKRG